MLCSNCKNPIADNSELCEWCGTILSKNEKNYKEDRLAANEQPFQFTPTGVIHQIRGYKLFLGSFQGDLKVGDSIQINFEKKDYNGIITSLVLREERINKKWYQLMPSIKVVQFVTGVGYVHLQIKVSKS
jgi:hypothetical protein